MKNHADPGPDIKVCTAKKKSDSPECGRLFYRPHNMSPKKWKLMKSCPECRQRRESKREDRTMWGHYEVKHPVIDAFLYGRLT